MGWGRSRFSEFDANNFQQILRDVQLPIVQNDKCERFLQTALNKYGQPRLGPNFSLHESFNCAG